MKLSGTIGVTQKTMTFEAHVCLILLHPLNPQERWGTHKKRWPFQPRPFADAIGLVRCSCDSWIDFLDCHCFRDSIKFNVNVSFDASCFSRWHQHQLYHHHQNHHRHHRNDQHHFLQLKKEVSVGLPVCSARSWEIWGNSSSFSFFQF